MSLAIRAGQRFLGEDVVQVLERIASGRGRSKAIRVDNGPEFASKALDQWAYSNKVELVSLFSGFCAAHDHA